MNIRIIGGKNLVDVYRDRDGLDTLYRTPDFLVQGDSTAIPIKAGNQVRAVFCGSVTGQRNGTDSISRLNIKDTAFHTVVCSKRAEQCARDIEGRYILVRIYDNGSAEICCDRYGKVDLYYQRIGDGIIFASDLSMLPFKENAIKYDQVAVAHSLLVYGFRPPKRKTLYTGVSRLGVNEIALWENNATRFYDTPPHIVETDEEFGSKHLHRYSDIFLDALEKMSSPNGNVVYVSSGWDSTSILAGLVHLHGPKNVRAVIGRFNFSDRSGISNPFELTRVKAVTDYFGVELDITEINHAHRGPEIVDRWEEFQRSHMFSGLSMYLWALLSEHITSTTSGEAIFSGEISDGIHNLGFSQHTTIHGHPVLAFREYSDKMASYLFGPNFFRLMLEKNAEEDVIYDLLKRQHQGKTFEKLAVTHEDCARQLFASLFTRDLRMPGWSLENSSILTKNGRESYSSEMEEQYFNAPAKVATPETLYSWYIHLYNSFHWQGGTVTTLGYTAEKQGFEMNLPFHDSRLHEFLSEMPESAGRGLEIRPTKYPLKWMLENKIDYPMHLQVGPHSYIYDTDPTFNFAGEFIYASAYTPLIKERLKHRKYEALLSQEYFDLAYMNSIVEHYLAGEEIPAEKADLSALAFLTLTGWYE